jgi:hypothetical protein
MITRGHLTEKSLTVKISEPRMGLCMLLQHRKARSISEENTSGLSVKPVERVAASDPNPTGKHTMDPVTYSRQRSRILINPSSGEK